MSLHNLLHEVLQRITEKDDSVFTTDVIKQKEYLESLDEPRDDIQRSYNQYLCQMRLIKNPFVKCLMNIASLPMIAFFLLKKKDKPINIEKYDGVFFADGKPDTILPECLTIGKRLKTISNKGSYRDKELMVMLKDIAKRHPFSWQFILKNLIKLEYFSFVIYAYTPDFIVSCNEYSFTSSILTLYCERMGIKHYNVMHGEKLYYIRDSFFRFEKCYIWDEYYRNLFIQLRAEKDQFEVQIPPSLIIKEQRKPEVDYTYYLGDEPSVDLERISDYLLILQESNHTVRVRPHPRFSNADAITIFRKKGISVEDTKTVDISHSLLSTKHAIALYSTVLNQAINNGIGTVIDDMTNRQKFDKLKSLKYRFADDDRVEKLSDIISI